MVAQRVALISSLLLGGNAARVARNEAAAESNVKFISGVPIMNYDMAFGGLLGTQDATENWNIFMKPGATDADVQTFCTRGKCLRQGHPSEGGVPYMEVRGTEKEVLEVLGGDADKVEFIEPDTETFVDPIVEPAGATWGLNRIGADMRESEGAGSNVYILDTGIRVTHQDFGGRATAKLDLSLDDGSVTECNGEATCANDVQGHGSHCAGSAAGTVYGVAPQASLYAVKVLGNSGSGSFSWSFDALDWLARKGERPAVASMSLGGSGVVAGMKVAVDAAVAAGVVVVVAAGNSRSDACRFSPAYVPTAITVGSTTSTDARSGFSNYGSCVNIWAPGSAVKSVGIGSDSATRTLSGTSMACPHVSGAAALVHAATPEANSDEVLRQLTENGVANGITGLRTGDTNLLLYVGAGGPPPTPVPPPTPPFVGCPVGTTGPDRDNDCRCDYGSYCHENDVRGCTYSYTASSGRTSTRYFLLGCTNCECK